MSDDLVKRALRIICPEDDPEYILSHPDEWSEVYCQNSIWIEMAHTVTRLVRNEALEEAARVAERGGCTASGCGGYLPSFEFKEHETWHSNLCPIGIAAAIRALKGK